MKIIVSGLHLKEFPQIEQYAKKKLIKLAKYNSKIEQIHARLISEKSHRGQDNDYYCEIEVVIPQHNLEIVDTERAMDKAIDKAVERMKRLLIKSKERQISRFHKIGILNKLRNRF